MADTGEVIVLGNSHPPLSAYHPAGTGPELGDLEITDLIQDHADWNRVARGWLAATGADKTRTAYRYDLIQFFHWCELNGVDALEADQENIDTYRHRLRSRYANPTVARKLAALSSFYRHGRRRFTNLVPDNPVLDVERPKGEDESTAAGLDQAETHAVFAAADSSCVRDAALVRVMVFVGLRVAELAGASVRDMRVERGQRVVRVTRKGGKRQTVVMPPEAAEAVDRYLNGRADGPLFKGSRGGPITRYEVDVILRRLTAAAGVDKSITPHSMRHTFATLALDAGVHIRDLQLAMGHKNVETTMRYDRARDRVDRSPAHALAKLLER